MSLLNLRENLLENEVGAKAFNLSKLLQAGVPVPDGFVIKNEYYQQKNLWGHAGCTFKNDLSLACAKLQSPYLMVRSSAIGEDSTDFSFAGQLDSFISKNNPSEIYNFVTKCWESLDNSRSKLYGEYSGKALETMGVIIQEMIEPDYAGVLFTHSPVNYEEAYLEWVSGHAEQLVSGKVTPEFRSFSSKNLPADLPFNLEKLLSLSDAILKLYKRPQDIEWAAKGNDVYIVQTRPITTVKHRLNWSNTNVNENYPDKLSPFLYSLARRSYYHYFKNLAKQTGVYPKTPEAALEIEHALTNIIGTWGHRMYYNMSNIHAVLSLTPFDHLFKKSFDDFVGYQKKISAAKKLDSQWKKTKFALSLTKHFLLLEGRVQEIEKMVDEYFLSCEEAHDLKTFSKSYHQFLHIRFNEWNKASFSDMFSMVTHGVLGKVSHTIDAERSQGLQNELLQAIPGLISNKPIFELYHMYQCIEKEPAHQKLFQAEPKVIWQELKKQKNSELYLVIEKYLREWGFRCSGELTFLTPNYCDEPANFIEMLKTYYHSKPDDPHVHFAKKHEEQILLVKKAHKQSKQVKGLKKFVLPLVFKSLVRLTCYSISCRERVRLKQAKLYYGAKITLLKLADLLVKKGLIEKSEDIFFFEYTEISRLLSGEELEKDYYHGLIQLRREAYNKAEQKKDNFATYLGDFSNDVINMDSDSTDGLKGLPACGGEVTGTIRVLESMHEIGRLNKGDILVTRQTDPGWICAFPMISGLIVERGGMLSHGAIVAREFGIPAIVGVENVTTILKDGQKIHLNAYNGTIKCLD
ncbi:MAG: PEP/pyruvate-binding domain-containing protein [Bacteriovoracaceae bacterium]